MIESERGCGYRKVGGIYMEGEGLSVPCDRLPYRLDNCPVCGSGIKFSRSFTWLKWEKYAGMHEKCKDKYKCPICKPEPEEFYGVMWVGKKFYSPESFVKEAEEQGISKRIATIPRSINITETWILLAHQEATTKMVPDPEYEQLNIDLLGNPVWLEEPWSAIFYAFKPTRIVKIVSMAEAVNPDEMQKLKDRGLTVLVAVDVDEKGNVKETQGLEEYLQNRPKSFWKELFKK